MSCSRAVIFVLLLGALVAPAGIRAADPSWTSPKHARVLLKVDSRGVIRSNSPATVSIDCRQSLLDQRVVGTFDENTIEVFAYDSNGQPVVFDASRSGYEQYLLPWRIEKYYGISKVDLSFVLPNHSYNTYAVYFDTEESGLGKPQRYSGMVGDGDWFREEYKRREIAPTHFDSMCDLDGDGDLDLFTGGVEPFIYCYENVGGNRFVERGRLTSGGDLLVLPHAPSNRSWVVPHFYDWDGDGDQDFFPSFTDGPSAGRILYYKNVTMPGGILTFVNLGALTTVSGTPLAGGATAGGWFPSITFVVDWDHNHDGRTDVLVASNNHCYLHRNLGTDGSGGWRLADAVTVRAGGGDIDLFNPRFEVADIDNDGDPDLFCAPQSGEIRMFENIDTSPGRNTPTFAAGVIIAYDEVYTQQSTHPGLKIADFNGDGLLDFVVGRAWAFMNLNQPTQTRDYGGLFENVGTATAPRWIKQDAYYGAPYTEQFQICDALRQNVVRGVDWNSDGRKDLIAGDSDGFVWYFRNTTNHRFPVFATGEKLLAGGSFLSFTGSGGHARPDICDWNNDGRKDLVASDGGGHVTLFLNAGTDAAPALTAGQPVSADGSPIVRGTRSHLLVCDWNNDGKKDLIFSDQENPGYYFFRNTNADAAPVFAAPQNIGLDDYTRPNLGSYVDWDGDGRKDFIGCYFENEIRLYENVGTGLPGMAPIFASAQGTVIVQPWSIMMISGADAIDWDGDGDVDILTGQGHGGSGLRFFEHDYINDGQHDSFPVVTIDDRPLRCPADFDGDNDVDQEDFGWFQGCLAGSSAACGGSCCTADLDADGDVDQSDFSIYQACVSGPQVPPPPQCLTR